MDQQDLSVQQFGANAAYYLASPVHAAGADLERLARMAAERRPLRALDLGCGAGHASFALARGGAAEVTAYDPAPDMLAVVAAEAAARGHAAIKTQAGSAEQLPIASHSIDLLVTRYSAHHWPDVPRALAECARVLRSDGRLIVIDVTSPEVPLLDTSLQMLEALRDGSHVRDYRVSEWRTMLAAAGFAAPAVDGWKIAMQFESWVARIGTPAARVAALRTVIPALPAEAQRYFKVGADCSFEIDTSWIESLLTT
jgi:ubiquinone/menaquinone biosynthesis C-methylase UbiE